MNARTSLLILGLVFLLQACVGGPQKPPKELLALTEAQMKIRSFQTRTVDVKEQKQVWRGVGASVNCGDQVIL